MGLNISVYRLIKCDGKEEEEGLRYFTITEEDFNFPQWTKEFITKKEEEYFDWEKFKEQSGIDVYSYKIEGEEFCKEGSFLYLRDENDKRITINYNDVPTYKQLDDVIYHKEIAYQRKGFNASFYEDYRKGEIGYFVWSKKELENYKDIYCDEERKEYFQEHIINKFEEGKDCVTFDW